MQDSWDSLLARLDWVAALPDAAFGAASRLSFAYVASFVAMAYLVHRLSGESRGGSFWRFLAPRHIYLHRSHLTDLQLFAAGRLLAVWGVFNFSVIAVAVAAGVIAVLSHVFGHGPSTAAGTWGDFLAVTILVAVASDFCTYWVHRLHHEQRLLWPFHKVHHSAEVLTPVTAYRKHPLYDVVASAAKAVPIGLLQGVVLFVLLGRIDIVAIGGANVVYVAFNFLGSNLRHSHIWFDFGPVLDRIFISPAQHQIHHSRAPRHLDRNYGEIFALWDWMFGTLYVPYGRESFEIGLADGTGAALPQPYGTFTRAMIEPFRDCRAALVPAPRARAP